MGQPIAVTDGIAFAFPNICLTPVGPATVPIPYPSIADLSAASDASSDVKAGSKGIILAKMTTVSSTKGDEAGTSGGVISGANGKACEFPTGSGTVKINGKDVVRMGDPTEQNKTAAGANANGFVLGGLATVLVGG